ncbi:transcription elongation factor [Cylindrobasidium torrendii FP15055 ss-10]|uniref:Transcription elongation factor n=1 Tax=Cylindrobasidium torrendii FP15055 ss-10 TaxID=1314674 RepID=A0A0D7B7E3_9AGAR|nr:transcription elongation factor [Cylindrobasidium torrendii FP15055 ss-10]
MATNGVELKSLVKQLSKASEPEILNILGQLKSGYEVTETLLRETKAGLAVGKLRQHASKDVANAAKDLVKKWKSDVGKKTAAAAEKTPAAKVATTTTSAPKKAKRSAKLDFGSIKATHDGTRDKCVELLYDALVEDSEVSKEQLLDIAVGIEAKVNEGESKDYRTRIRQLYVNLKDKKNPTLKTRVVDGTIAPARFATMSSAEMASDERKKEDAKIMDENLFKALSANEQQAETDGFQCGRCKQRKCVYRQAQTRSADEPMTTFVTCTNCGHKWKFS